MMYSAGVSRVNARKQPRTGEQLPVAELLVAELNGVDACLDQRNHKPLELVGRGRPSTST